MKTISRFGFLLITTLTFSSCATAYNPPDIPTIKSPRLQAFVNREAKIMLAVTPNAGLTNSYRFYLAHGRRQGWAGLSAGNHVIYLDYSIVKAGFLGTRGLTQFRITLAHEIGHDMAGHVANQAAIVNATNAGQVVGQGMSYVPGVIGLVGNVIGYASFFGGRASKHLYLRSAELEADRLGIEYWKRLGWDCKQWVYRFEGGLDSGVGDFHHPPEVRLRQAADLCLPPNERPRIYEKVEQFEAKALDERDEKREDEYDE